ncbi:MAG: outer membrane beta-barrel protein [Bryobacteraceae bacterium]
MRKVSILALVVLGAASLQAQESEQPVTLGFKVGVPVTDMFSASNTTQFSNSIPGSFTSAVPRYEFGVSGEFHLPLHLRFEIDGLYKRGGFDSESAFGSGAGLAFRPTTFNDWQVPGLFKYNIAMGHFRPFVDFGASLRHISTITQTTYAPGFSYGEISDNSIALHNRNSVGGVAGFGFTFKKGPFELIPEARYTRWANESFETDGLRTNLDQGDVLLGISF